VRRDAEPARRILPVGDGQVDVLGRDDVVQVFRDQLPAG
jgi:hypothetical protein